MFIISLSQVETKFGELKRIRLISRPCPLYRYNLDKNSTDYLTSTHEESSTTNSMSPSTLVESSTTSSENIVSETSITIFNNDITRGTTSSDTMTTKPTTQESVFHAVSQITTVPITDTTTEQIFTESALTESAPTTLASLSTMTITSSALEALTTEVIS